MTTKFQKTLALSNESIKEKRANLIGSNAKRAYDQKLNKLNDTKAQIEATLLNLEDLNVMNGEDLSVAKKDFDSEAWLNSMLDEKIKLVNIEVEIEILESIGKEWFAESKDTNE